MKRLLIAAATCSLVAVLALVGGPAIAATGVGGGTPSASWASYISNYTEAGYENFTYANGNLALTAASTWPGTSSGNTYVENNTIRFKPQAVGGSPSYDTWTLGAGYGPYTPASGEIVVGIMPSNLNSGGSAVGANGYWGIEALDASGNIFAAIEGGGPTSIPGGVRVDKMWGRVGLNGTAGSLPATAGVTTSAVTLATNVSNPVWMVINTGPTKTVDFYYWNGIAAASIGSLAYTATTSTTLGKIRIAAYGDTWGTSKAWMYADNLTYGTNATVPEPSSLLAFSAFGAGMFGFIKRRRA